MRRALLLAALLGAAALALPRLALAQGYTVYFGEPADTALGLIPGGETRIPVRASYLCSTVKAGRFTIRYDTTVVTFVGVVPGALMPISTSSPGPGLYSVSDTGTVCGSDVVLFSLRAVLRASRSGMFIWTTVDSLTLSTYTGDQARTERTQIAQFCHATRLFGDIDGDGSIDSRDALIALSAAVGLPIPNTFNLAIGDVDRSGLVNSGDALLMLSWAIGLPITNINVQLGEAAPDACPGTTAPGEDAVFKRGGAGIELLRASSTAPTLVPGTVRYDSAPRLVSGDTLIVYQCADSVYPTSYSAICRISPTGTGRAHLTPQYPTTAYGYHTLPDVSPNARRVIYISSGQLVTVLDSVGAPQTGFPGTAIYANGVAWSRNASQVAYTSSGYYVYVNAVYTYFKPGLWVVDTLNTTAARLDTLADYGTVRWSPAGDSVAFVRVNNSSDGRIWAVPAAGGAVGPLTNFAGVISGFDWGPQGLIFSLDPGNGRASLWLLPSQNAPIQRVTAPGPGSGDWQPSFRRNP